jgi:polar amino acid transport system permease protein
MDYGVMFQQLLKGCWVTIEVFCMTYILSIPLGMLVTLGVRGRFKPLKWFLEAFIYVMRGTPLILQIFFIWYGLPFIPGIGSYLILPSRFAAIMIAFTLNYAAYFAEIFRGGLLAVDKGQYEAAKVLGLSRSQTMLRIIFPQMFRVALPSLANETITLVKDTSLVFVIGLGGLLEEATNIANAQATIIPYVFCAIFYLILTTAPAIIFKKLEKKFSFQ